MSTPIVVHGAAGRMGQRIIALSTEGEFDLKGAVDHATSPLQGKDAGEAAGIASLGIPITNKLSFPTDAIVIDFSHHKALDPLLESVLQSQTPLVCGTTGLTDKQIERLHLAGEHIPVLFSPNMSVGVNVLFRLARQVAQTLGEDFDTEIMEIHHRFKKDAPSGTAVRLAEEIAQGREVNFQEKKVYSRDDRNREREINEIGVQSLRGGDIPGEHTVFFCGFGERIELTHRALTRDIFARGALRAAAWLHGKPKGFYNMYNVLGMED